MKNILILLTLLLLPGYSQDLDCNNANTTYELMDCQKIKITNAEEILNKYWTTSRQRYKDDKEVISRMDKSQEAWIAYRKSHCSTIHQIFIHGTVRGLMHGSCLLDMTKKRTHEIWETYLTYMDSTPAILREPK